LLEKERRRLRDRLAEARLRETNYLMSFDLAKVNGWLVILLMAFITLNFLDAMTTLVAISLGPSFVELNPIASGLFRLDFPGFIGALALKYAPIVPLVYATFLPSDTKRTLALRIVKVSTLVALAAAVVFYSAVVGSNSLNLVRYFYRP